MGRKEHLLAERAQRPVLLAVVALLTSKTSDTNEDREYCEPQSLYDFLPIPRIVSKSLGEFMMASGYAFAAVP